MPDVELIEHKIPPPENLSGRPLNFNYNDVKLKIWVDYLEKFNENLIFADCDMICVRPAYHAFDKEFDVAFTARTTTNRIPMNGGIMFARPTEAAKKFFREMLETNHKMLKDVMFHQKWRKLYAGMNQAAFGCVYEKYKKSDEIKIHKYKTIEWNAVDCDWSKIDDSTVFIHYKSKLRKLVLANKRPFGIYTKVMKRWYQYRDNMIKKCNFTTEEINEMKKQVNDAYEQAIIKRSHLDRPLRKKVKVRPRGRHKRRRVG
jgi:hypothetical protein